MNDVQDELKIVRQNLLLANKFLPKSKSLKLLVQQLEVTELGNARKTVDRIVRETLALQTKIDNNKIRIKTLAMTFEKTTKTLKNTGVELDKIIQLIGKMNSQ
jgi:hypothetical protein